MEKVRKIGLDRQAIKKAIQDLQQMKNEVNALSGPAIEEILTEAVNYCRSITPISDKEGNHLADNTYWEKTPNGYRIVQEGEHVAYVEFGTGVVGRNNPHDSQEALNEVGWQYGSGKTIFTTKDGKTGWFYPEDAERKHRKFTEGQPANMQMYRTALWLEERLGVKVKYIVSEAVKKW